MVEKDLILKNSTSYAEKFGIDVSRDPFPWFLLSLLFGTRISEGIALRTFKIFMENGLTAPEKIVEAGWEKIVSILDEGGYTRYDFKTATKLITVSENIIKCGGLKRIHDESVDSDDLFRRLKSLSSGIGDVTVGIFMREMVDVWNKARPIPSYYALTAMKNLSLDIGSYRDIEVRYSVYEYFLHKVGRNCVKGNCNSCPVKAECRKYVDNASNISKAL